MYDRLVNYGRPMATQTNPKSHATVFYSWQSDLPNPTNRSLIQDALERAAKKIKADESVTVEPVVDRDTQNVPGSPDIAHTIFQKIEKASAFVADVSIINQGQPGRPTPNPNVLIELGYAIHALTHSRTILVANTAMGVVETLPFDLRTKRVLTYNLPPGATDKPEQRKKLQDGLEAALRAVLELPSGSKAAAATSDSEAAISAIEAKSSNQAALCKKFMKRFVQKVQGLMPKFDPARTPEWDEDLVRAINEMLDPVTEFARIAEAAAVHDSRDAALGLFRGLPGLFILYDTQIAGISYVTQFDFPKFIGHELIVTLFAGLIAERRWKIVGELSRERLAIEDANRRHADGTVTFEFGSRCVSLLEVRNQNRNLARVSCHADLLKERHVQGALGEHSPWYGFQDADVYLFLRSMLSNEKTTRTLWSPWSVPLLHRVPAFLVEAIQREKAEELLEPLGVETIPELRSRLAPAISRLQEIGSYRNHMFDAFDGFNVDGIGSR